MMELMGPTGTTYAAAYEALIQRKSIQCATKGTIFEAVLAPTIVLVDVSDVYHVFGC